MKTVVLDIENKRFKVFGRLFSHEDSFEVLRDDFRRYI
jgi:hypothetical protein